jgi:Flp pilus assembly pilin Flp
MTALTTTNRPNRKASRGQTLAEYGLIVALIAVFCITALSFMGTSIDQALNFLGGQVSGTITSVG